MISKSYLHHEMDRGVKESGVKRIRIHDLRHSHVSLLIYMGFSAVAIGNRVGHESAEITYRYSNDYEEKLREIRAALNRIPKYRENPEFKKTIENAQRVAAALENMVVTISQSEAVKAFGKLAEQLSNIKLPQLSEEAKEGLGNYHYLNKLESLQLNQ